jgi:hypothetical protein
MLVFVLGLPVYLAFAGDSRDWTQPSQSSEFSGDALLVELRGKGDRCCWTGSASFPRLKL